MGAGACLYCGKHYSFRDRKWGAMHLSNLGTVFLGAPEMLLKENPAPVVEAQARGSRVLVSGLTVQN